MITSWWRGKIIPLLGGFFFSFFLDQVTKWWAMTFLYGKDIPVFPGLFELTLQKNTGSAFSLRLLTPTWLFLVTVLISLIFLILTFWPSFRMKASFYAGVGLFLAGAWGNQVDRFRFGYVIDFLKPSFWATFNVADLSIIVGLLLIFLNVWMNDTISKKTKDQSL
ncbi:MAG: signal peptidase II [Atribacterota bacterium]